MIIILMIIYRLINKAMYYRNQLFMCSLKGYLGVYFPHCLTTWEMNSKITLSPAHKQFTTHVHISFSIYPAEKITDGTEMGT